MNEDKRSFSTREDLDRFLAGFPERRLTDTPGIFSLGSGRYLGVRGDLLTATIWNEPEHDDDADRVLLEALRIASGVPMQEETFLTANNGHVVYLFGSGDHSVSVVIEHDQAIPTYTFAKDAFGDVWEAETLDEAVVVARRLHERRTYLDAKNDPNDPDETWELDDPATPAEECRRRALEWLRHGDVGDPEILALIIRGAAGLLERHVTDDPYRALETAIVWYYG